MVPMGYMFDMCLKMEGYYSIQEKLKFTKMFVVQLRLP